MVRGCLQASDDRRRVTYDVKLLPQRFPYSIGSGAWHIAYDTPWQLTCSLLLWGETSGSHGVETYTHRELLSRCSKHKSETEQWSDCVQGLLPAACAHARGRFLAKSCHVLVLPGTDKLWAVQ